MSNKELQPTAESGAVDTVQAPISRQWYTKSFDRPLLLIILALVGIGTVMVFSASYAEAEMYLGDPYYFARRQIAFVSIGVVIMLFVSINNWYNLLRKFAVPVFVFILGLNYLVPIIGYASHGATRWIEVAGINLQPSELLKFGVILLFAHIISSNTEVYRKSFGKSLPKVMLLVMIIGVCLLSTVLQQHLSATIIIAMLAFLMMFIGGIRKRTLLIILVVVLIVAAIALLLLSSFFAEKMSHVATRLKVWSDPFQYMKDAETNDAGWQPAQSLYAIASGGLWGVGLSQSNEKHGYLPEAQNDYIFSIMCEEMGFFMAVAVIALFIAFIWRGFVIAKNATDDFCRMLIMGIILQIGIQVILNIAVVTNSIPSTGISLPFFSYGGSSLVVLLAQCGIVLSLSRYTYENNA